MKTPAKTTRKRILALTACLEQDLGLGWWTIRHHFNETDSRDDDTIIADTSCNWEYRDATITWFLPICAAQSDDELLATAIHEYVHILLAPIESDCTAPDKVKEYAVESVAKMILAAYRH